MPLVTTPVHIMLVDDHPLVRLGVRSCLSAVTGFLVENEASNASSALALLAHTHIDVVLVDIGQANSNGLDLIGQIGREYPNVATVVLTMSANHEYVVRAIEEGARGYVLKDSPVTEIAAAIHAVSAGGTFFSQRLVRFLRSAKHAPEEPTLTGRELEVLNEIVRGHSNKVIASTFDLSIRTVETHRKNIRSKVGAESTIDLLKYAARLGLLKF
jgi:DNA-binding NarL/FixJ family response regulator